MFCPNCGATHSTEQKFCRSCGFNLEQTAKSLVEQKPMGASIVKSEKALERFGTIAFTGFGIVVFLAVIGIIYKIIDTFILSGKGILSGIIFILFIVFAMMGLAYVIANEHLKDKRLKANALSAPGTLEAADTGKLLEEGDFEPAAASVTERTTDLLYTENKTRTLE